jgi:hypothetical protein
VFPPESVSLRVKVAAPEPVGVPSKTQVCDAVGAAAVPHDAPSSTTPAGKAPAETDQMYGETPPLSCTLVL